MNSMQSFVTQTQDMITSLNIPMNALWWQGTSCFGKSQFIPSWGFCL